MDFIRKILEFLSDKSEVRGMVFFNHEVSEDGSQRVITIHADPEGFVVMTIFTPEEWEMILSVVELTGESLEEVVKTIADDNNVATITLDPKDFPA